MIIEVRVKTSSKKTGVIKEGDIYFVSLKSKPFHNSANLELIDTLSSYFNIAKSSVKISKGLKSKKKLIEIQDL